MSTPDTFAVVVNDEEQHSLWAAREEPPAGWRRTGFTGTTEDCVAHIDEVWPDIRPLSLRRRLASGGTGSGAGR